MGKIGIAFSGGPNPAEIVDLVVLAESLNYDSAWVAEGHGGDQFAILAACAMRTSRIRLGTSISSVFVRTAPTIAMAASSVADLSGGRFVLGLGSSHKVQVEPEHGVVYGKPLTRTRETVAIVRALLATGAGFEGEDDPNREFRFVVPAAVSMFQSTSRPFPRGVALAGEVPPTAWDPGHAVRSRQALPFASSSPMPHARPAAARPHGGDVTAADGRRRYADAARHLAAGCCALCRILPRYNQLMAGHGLAQRLRQSLQPETRRPPSRGACCERCHDRGDQRRRNAEQCRARIEAYRQSGIDTPILSPLPAAPTPGPGLKP
jgi:alkanesulfonate monooxygenase SsuD/methylene tetrahydromethanopterin reductase-like flavin-dependent oxidoreductase (luciferase family)